MPKLKTRKSIAKRVKRTGTGKYMISKLHPVILKITESAHSPKIAFFNLFIFFLLFSELDLGGISGPEIAVVFQRILVGCPGITVVIISG